MDRTIIVVAILGAALISTVAPQKSSAAIGATSVGSATEAPWSVHIEMTRPGSEVGGGCSGSILDANEILTAGHCITSTDRMPWHNFEVRAGTTTLGGTPGGQEQVRDTVLVRAHPFYETDTFLEDVAVLEVEPPFDFSTPYVQPILIAPSGSRPPADARFFGWGDIAPETFSSEEHQLELTPLHQWQCPKELQGERSLSCMHSSTGSSCPGDSGSGIVGETPPQLFVSVSLGFCTPGGPVSGTDLTSPEIRDWLAGDPTPPQAPEAQSYPMVRGRIRVGAEIRCEAGSWSGHPKITSAFVEPRRGRVLQTGSSTRFKVPRAMLSRRIACVSIAANLGGRTEIRSSNNPVVRSRH